MNEISLNEFLLLGLVRRLRQKYFPKKLNVGSCITVCLIIGYILSTRHHKTVRIVDGSCGDCYHSWLEIDQINIDPARDTTGPYRLTFTPDESITDEDVILVDSSYGNIRSIDIYNWNDYYTDTFDNVLSMLMANR